MNRILYYASWLCLMQLLLFAPISEAGSAEQKLTGTLFSTPATEMPAANAFDGNTNTYFEAKNGSVYVASGGYVGIDLGVKGVISKVRYYPRSSYAIRMSGGKFQGGNDATNGAYTDLYTIPSTPPTAWSEATVSDTTPYRYLRYYGPDLGYCNVAEIEFWGDPSLPVISNAGGASNVTSTSASLNGSLVSTGLSATVTGVCWGTNDGGTVQANWSTNVWLGAKDVGPVSLPISSLSVGTRYYYRFLATNTAGESWASSSAYFITIGGPTAADNSSGASNITITSATLQGTVTGGSPPAMVYFFWNTSDGGTNKTAWTNEMAAGIASNGTVYANLTGLLPDRIYFYRCYASNTFGEVWAPTSTDFSTLALVFPSWRHKLPITFSGYARTETLTNFPALVVLSTNISGFLYSNFQTNRTDLRFTDSTETNALNYDVEKWDTNGSSYVWVQIPRLTSNAVIFAYWGKDDATSVPAYTTNGATWTNGFIGVWHMSEGGTGTRYDSSTNQNIGAPSGYEGDEATNGMIAGADHLDGVNDYINCAHKACQIASSNSWAVSLWAKLPNEVRTSPLVSKRMNGGAYTQWQVYQGGADSHGGTGKRIDFVYLNSAARSGRTDADVANGNWHHLTLVADIVSNATFAYVDGIRTAYTMDHNAGIWPNINNTDPLRFGSDNGTAYGKATLDEIRIENVTRSSNWVWACYMNQASNGVFAGSFNAYSNVLAGGSPVIVNSAATDITGSSATLNGTLTSTGQFAAVVGVYWGTNDGDTVQANWSTNVWLGSRDPGPVSIPISSLSVGTRYYYRFLATNTAGESWASTSDSFITLGGPTYADNGAGASNITVASAILQGTVTGGSPAATVYFFWNTSDGGTNKDAWTNSLMAGTASTNSVYATLSNLSANQTYFYRCYGSNAHGEVWASASTNFATPSPTLTINDTQVTKGPAGINVILSFPVTLSTPSAIPITVDFATSNGLAMAGSDYIATSGTLTIPAGSIIGLISVTILGSNADQWPSRDLYMNLATLNNAAFADNQAHGIIVITNDIAETKIWTGTGDWTSLTNWSPAGAQPSPSDIVFIKSGICTVSAATTYVPTLTVSNGATLLFANWMSSLSVGNMTVRNTGLVTHIPCDTNAVQSKTNRVFISCTNLTVDAGGRIDASGQGYRGATNAATSRWGQGPGGGYYQCGGGYGGIGGYGGYGGTPGASYGSVTTPEDPGSGGGTHGSGAMGGGDGGGAVRIDAAELVTVNGAITAHGIGMGNQGNGGAGGSVLIRCRAIAGNNGVVGADGGDNLSDNFIYSGGCGGGGRVALVYDTTAQSIQNLSARPLLTISASQGYGFHPGGPGSIYLSDASFFPHPATLSGGQIIIPGFTEWTTANLNISNGMAVFPDGFNLSVSNTLTVCGTGGGLLLTNSLLHVGGDLTLTGRAVNCIYLYGGTASTFRIDGNLSLWSGRFYYYDSRTTNTELVVGGNLLLTNAAALYTYSFTNTSGTPFAAGIKVASNMLLGASSWVYPVSDPINGASSRFIVGRDLMVADTNSGFSADAAGFRGGISSTNRGCGPGAGTGSGGAGYGGAGGVGGYTPSIPGVTYGDSNAPSLPGSGGGMHLSGGGIGGKGGGLVWIEVEKTLLLNGIISANGGGPGYYQSGGGSGGGIYLTCRILIGGTSAIVRANGSSATLSSTAGSGGGSGRIAIRHMIEDFSGTVTADGGLGYTAAHYGGAGTIVWYIIPPGGTVYKIR